jgi:hypothetical protein
LYVPNREGNRFNIPCRFEGFKGRSPELKTAAWCRSTAFRRSSRRA